MTALITRLQFGTCVTISILVLGETDVVAERWSRLTDSNYHAPFLAVARKGEASPDDIVNELDDATRKDVKNWLEGPFYKWDDLIPYYRVGDGKFALSTTGKYFARNYATPANDETEPDEEPSRESEDGDQQTSFDDVAQTESDSDE